jgi:predicted dinucleotide-binding enzyme
MVKIGIIGTGGVGVALATGWGAKGHTIVFGSRDPTSNKSKEVINKVKNCKVVSITEAIQQSDV